MVRSLMSASCARISCCAIEPVSSRSLLVMSPCGLLKDTKRCWIVFGKRLRQRMGTISRPTGTKWTPPIPSFAASTAPKVAGNISGTSSAILVGLRLRSLANHRKSSRKSCTGLLSRILRLSSVGCRSASCNVENNPRAPGMAAAMDRSSPSTWCQALVETRFWSLWIDANIS